MPIIGEIIRKTRKVKGWTQTQLALKLNKSTQVISNWERGYTSLNHEDVAALSKVFEIPADKILGENKMIREVETVIDTDLKKKMQFLEELERDLGLNLTDPQVQKMLKRAAKVIFTDES